MTHRRDAVEKRRGPRRVGPGTRLNTRLKQPPRWIAIVTGLLTIVLLASAVALIGMQMSRLSSDSAVSDETTSDETVSDTVSDSVSESPPPPVAPVEPPPPGPPPAPPPAVIAAPCLPNSTDGVTVDGSVAYCALLQGTDRFLWSLYPGEVVMPVLAFPEQDPAVVVCMEQTLRAEPDCLAYLAQPNNPGNGGI